jgi:hypothetical protein
MENFSLLGGLAVVFFAFIFIMVALLKLEGKYSFYIIAALHSIVVVHNSLIFLE